MKSYPHASGLIQWARGGVGLKPSAAARPRAEWCGAAAVQLRKTSGWVCGTMRVNVGC